MSGLDGGFGVSGVEGGYGVSGADGSFGVSGADGSFGVSGVDGGVDDGDGLGRMVVAGGLRGNRMIYEYCYSAVKIPWTWRARWTEGRISLRSALVLRVYDYH